MNFKKISMAALALCLALATTSSAATAAESARFKSDVLPILDTYCVACHNPAGSGYEASGLDMTTYEGLMSGTSHGPIIVPGDAFTSNLMAVLEGRTSAAIGMPHKDRRDMTKDDRRVLRKWIISGASRDGHKNGPAQVIKELCQDCHQPGGSGFVASGLDMTSYEKLMKGTRHGPVIVPGDAFTSNLMVLVEGRAKGGLKMPHNELEEPTANDRKTLRRWINQGAKND